jgi:hypothetical protein
MIATTFFANTALDWWYGIQRVEGEGIYQWMELVIEGLNNELQKSVKLRQATTIDEAINVAQRVSATFHSPNQSNPTFTRSNYRQPSTTNRSNSHFKRTTTGSRFAPLAVENVEEVSGRQPYSPQCHCEGRTHLTDIEFSYLNAEQKKL